MSTSNAPAAHRHDPAGSPEPVSEWPTELLIDFLVTDAVPQVGQPSFYSINKKLREEARAELLERADTHAPK